MNKNIALSLLVLGLVLGFSSKASLAKEGSRRAGMNVGAFAGPTVAYELNSYLEVGSFAQGYKRIAENYEVTEGASVAAYLGAVFTLPYECHNTKMSLRPLGFYPGFVYSKTGGYKGTILFDSYAPVLNLSVILDPVELIAGPVVNWYQRNSNNVFELTLMNVEARVRF